MERLHRSADDQAVLDAIGLAACVVTERGRVDAQAFRERSLHGRPEATPGTREVLPEHSRGAVEAVRVGECQSNADHLGFPFQRCLSSSSRRCWLVRHADVGACAIDAL